MTPLSRGLLKLPAGWKESPSSNVMIASSWLRVWKLCCQAKRFIGIGRGPLEWENNSSPIVGCEAKPTRYEKCKLDSKARTIGRRTVSPCISNAKSVVRSFWLRCLGQYSAQQNAECLRIGNRMHEQTVTQWKVPYLPCPFPCNQSPWRPSWCNCGLCQAAKRHVACLPCIG